ncbi:MAG TPA: fasciclin domain-containing protein [Caulobacteraceae bacterium]
MISTRPFSAAAAALLVLASVPAFAQPAAPAPAPAPAQAPPAPAPAQTPASAAAPTPIPPPGTAYRPIAPAGDILATLQASGQFKIFVQAVTATNLAQIFKTQPNITVFAPTDAAFNSLPADQLAALQKNIPALQKLVTYHLINTRITSAQIVGHAATSIPTVSNAPVAISGEGGSVKVNGASVLQADVMASNGVIFVIDQVLQPAGAPPAAPPAPAAPAAPAAAPPPAGR